MITQEAVQYWKACSAGSPKTSLAQVEELLLAAEKIPQRVTKGDAQALLAEIIGAEQLIGTKLIAAVRERMLKWAQEYSTATPTLGRMDLSPLAVQIAIMVRGLSSDDRQPYRDLLVAMMGRNFQLDDLMSLVLKHNLPNLIDWKPETAAQALEIVKQLPAAEPVPVEAVAADIPEGSYEDAVRQHTNEVDPPPADEVAAVTATQEFNPQGLLGKAWRHRDGAAAKVAGIQGFGEAAVLEVTILDDPSSPPQPWPVHRFLEEFTENVAHPDQMTLVPPALNPDEVGASLSDHLTAQVSQNWPPELLRSDPPAYQETPPCPTAPAATTEPPSQSPTEAPATSETGSSSSPAASTTEPQATAPSGSVVSDIDPVPPPLSSATSAAPAPTPLTFPSAGRLEDLKRKEAELTTLIGQAQQELDQVHAAITDEERTGEKRRKREELARQLAALDAELGEAS